MFKTLSKILTFSGLTNSILCYVLRHLSVWTNDQRFSDSSTICFFATFCCFLLAFLAAGIHDASRTEKW